MKQITNIHEENTPSVILVRPQLAENMGMVARAMMNCGLSDLRFVCPRDNHLNEKAVSAASGAQSVLEEATVYENLSDAIADKHFILATTARPRDMVKPVYTPAKAIEMLEEHRSKNLQTAILFGAERTGLENNELICANGIIEIPLNPRHSSLNLSQAVLLIGYEWFQKVFVKKDTSHFETGDSAIATKQEVDSFLLHLETELEKRGYFRFPDKKERMRHNLRNIFTRQLLSVSETKTLHGVVTDLIRPVSK